MKIVFFGSSGYVLPIIEQLRKVFEIELVITTEKENGLVSKFCNEKSLTYISIQSLSDQDTKYKILNTKSQLAILADFGLIIPDAILNKFKYGILNIRPSLLPKYRGASPVQAAILNNEQETGVSVIKLDNKTDHGPLLIQVKEKIKASDTAQSLYERLFTIGSSLLYQNIQQYIKGQLKLIEQNHENATFTKLLSKTDGYFDISNPPSLKNLALMIRAYYPWPGVWTKTIINGKSSIIKFLPQQRLQVEGKKPVSFKDFLNGYSNLDKNLLKLLK
jgi:methionyl-tRNA formyltransferase